MYLASADNRLLLDLEDQAQSSELRAELGKLKEGGQVLLEEALPGPGDAWMPGPGGHYVTEVVVPLVQRPPAAAAAPAAPRRELSVSARDRVRAPGSDWLFAKLYCPPALQDDLLIGPVREFCELALASGGAADWFFIRYADPDPHLRLRFRGQPDRLIGQLAPELCAWADNLIGRGLCSRLCLDTYERELERYGGPVGTSVAESVFGADSRFAVAAVRLCRTGLLAADLTTLGVLSIDNLLAALGAGHAQRLAWYRAWSPAKSPGGQAYRQRQSTLRTLLGDPGQLRRQPGGDALARALAAREDELEQPAQRLNELIATGEISRAAGEPYRSYVHLHCNRVLGPGRSAEDQIVDLLRRTRYSLSQAPLIASSRQPSRRRGA